MIVVMDSRASENEKEQVLKRLENLGFKIHLSEGVERTIIGAIGDKTILNEVAIEAMPGVEKVVPILQPYKLVSREFKKTDTVVKIDDLEIGGSQIQVMAGPCAVESKEQLFETAELVRQAGATILRGGAFKPRTSPYAFQGLEEEGLKYLAEARERTGLKIVTEVVTPMAMAAIAAGADGLIIEVHPNPAQALCDGPQSLTPPNFENLMNEIKNIAEVMGKTL